MNSTYFCGDCNSWHTSSGGNKVKKRTGKNVVEEQEVHSIDRGIRKRKGADQTLHIKNFNQCP